MLGSLRFVRRGCSGGATVAVAYSYQHADAEGAVTGGLTDFAPPDVGYFPLDHDQRHTLHVNFNSSLPWHMWLAGDVYYGSGFPDGESEVPRYLESHTTFDASFGKTLGESLL